MAYDFHPEPAVLKAQRELLKTLIESSSQEDENLLQGILKVLDEKAERASYYPIIYGEYLEYFARYTVESWDAETLQDFAATQLVGYWQQPEGEEDLDTHLDADNYFDKRCGFIKKEDDDDDV